MSAGIHKELKALDPRGDDANEDIAIFCGTVKAERYRKTDVTNPSCLIQGRKRSVSSSDVLGRNSPDKILNPFEAEQQQLRIAGAQFLGQGLFNPVAF